LLRFTKQPVWPKHIGVTTFNFWGHVTSSITWVTIRFTICHFLLMVYWNWACISNRTGRYRCQFLWNDIELIGVVQAHTAPGCSSADGVGLYVVSRSSASTPFWVWTRSLNSNCCITWGVWHFAGYRSWWLMDLFTSRTMISCCCACTCPSLSKN